MFRRIDCRKYWQWKRQQESKSKKEKRKTRKRKRKESVTDCIDDVEQSEATEVVFKAGHPKRKMKKKTPWIPAAQQIKRVPLADLLLKSIKPSMEVREYFHNPRHTACLQLTSLDIDIAPKIVESTMTASFYSQTQMGGQIKDRKKCGLSARRKTKDDENENRRQLRKISSRKDIEEWESDEKSDCESICSSDSVICLEGTKLTSKDKKEIKKYQSQAQANSNKEEE